MHAENWARMETTLDRFGIRPLVGIVPDNQDAKLKQSPEDLEFWDKARDWQRKGWTIALHGLHHRYHRSHGGINPLWDRSEFVGVALEEQITMIVSGKKTLEDRGLRVEWFFAPSHTFDGNTVKALKTSGISKISDTIAFAPYRADGMLYVPQIGGKCRNFPVSGVYTFCFHPNTMKESDFRELELFLELHTADFAGFDDIDVAKTGPISIAGRLLRSLYFFRRKLRRK